VKYIALIHNNPAAWQALSQTERDEYNSDADTFLEGLTESGELRGGAVVLAHPSNARTVRVRNGVPAVTDGPFAEGKEVLAGYYLLECESIERATEIVTHDPSARFFAVEVRPIVHIASRKRLHDILLLRAEARLRRSDLLDRTRPRGRGRPLDALSDPRRRGRTPSLR
jgi:hypothetical protein